MYDQIKQIDVGNILYSNHAMVLPCSVAVSLLRQEGCCHGILYPVHLSVQLL